MLIVRFEPTNPPGTFHIVEHGDEHCLSAIYEADTALGTPALTLPGLAGGNLVWVQLPFNIVRVANSGVTSTNPWSMTAAKAGVWHVDVETFVDVPGGWAAANIHLAVQLAAIQIRGVGGAPADKRFFAVGDAWPLQTSFDYDIATKALTIWMAQDGAAPQTITNWTGWVNVSWQQVTDCP